MFNLDEVSLANKIKGSSNLSGEGALAILKTEIAGMVIDAPSAVFDDLFFEDKLHYLTLAYQSHPYEESIPNLLTIISHIYTWAQQFNNGIDYPDENEDAL